MQNFDDNEDEDNQSDESALLPLAETLTDAIALSLQSIDFYTHEAINATHNSRFFNAQISEIIPDTFPILPMVSVAHAFKLLSADDAVPSSPPHNSDPPPLVLPTVFVSDLNDMGDDASSIANAFTLNVEQRRVFYLIADHALHRQDLPNQLLMGVFGEAGTGKTQVIKALQAWFTRLNRANELLVTATTATAAINIHGRTVHNATGIAIEMDDVTWTSRVTDKIESMRR